MGDLIVTTAALEAACEAARSGGYLSLDTEFVWRQTYLPQLGIVQLGAGGECRAVDCAKGLDQSPLGAAVADESIVKILHDARQDLALVKRYTGASPKNVFDTQLAAAFAGFPSGIGLQKLLFEALDIGLAKTETCTDWTRRPLSEAQIRYALDDVRHLAALREELLRRADGLGTRAWLEEEMTRYNDVALYDECVPSEMWRRVKLRRAKLDRRGFAVLRAAAELREKLAMEWNQPRTWLGTDESLVEMAERGRVGRLVHRLGGGRAAQLRALYAEAVAAALETPEDECPEDPRVHYIGEVLDAADKAVDWLEKRSAELHVDHAAIANRATITAFVDNVADESNPLACGWRWEAVGREMAERFGVD